MVPPCVTATMSRPRCSAVRPVDRRAHALDEIDEALPAGRTLVRRARTKRVRADLALGIEGLALEALPLAQVLLGELGNGNGPDAGVAAIDGRHDGRRGLPGARKVAGQPDRVVRKLARQDVEDVRRRAIAVEIALAIDAPAIGHGSVSDPPPARHIARHPHYSIVTTILPMALRAPSRAIASPALASG